MNDRKLQDPMEFFRNMLTNFQESGNTILGQTMRTEEFTRLLQGAWQLSAFSEKAVGAVMEQCLAQMHLPSRAEVAELGARLQRIEDMLNQLVSERFGARARRTGLPRTRRPPPVAGAERPKPVAKKARRRARRAAR